jgi:hypothetical protein
MAAMIFGAGVAMTIAKKTGHWLGAAKQQGAAQYVDTVVRLHSVL